MGVTRSPAIAERERYNGAGLFFFTVLLLRNNTEEDGLGTAILFPPRPRGLLFCLFDCLFLLRSAICV